MKSTLHCLPLCFTLLLLAGCGASNTTNDQAAAGQSTAPDGYWLAFTDSVSEQLGYKDAAGTVQVPAGKYQMCFTDTFRTYAIVAHPDSGLVAIDRQGQVKYHVFQFDNGPDQVAEGLFRIQRADKIGYADALSGEIVIAPQFACAYPFADGLAKVSNDCQIETDGEYSSWISNSWYSIDRGGKKTAGGVSKPSQK